MGSNLQTWPGSTFPSTDITQPPDSMVQQQNQSGSTSQGHATHCHLCAVTQVAKQVNISQREGGLN